MQRRHGIIDVYKMNESNWILDKGINYEYCSFCRYVTNKSVINILINKSVKINMNILYHRSQLLPENDAVLIPFDCSVVRTLSLKTFKLESTLDPSKLSYSNKLGTVMAMKSLMNDFVLVAYEGGQLLLWDMRKNDVLSSLTVEQYPMTFDFDASLMQGILGSASEKLEVQKIDFHNSV